MGQGEEKAAVAGMAEIRPLGPEIVDRQRRPLGEERLHAPLVLLRRDGAGGVDEPRAGPQAVRGCQQELGLKARQRGHVGGLAAPAGVGAGAESAEGGAGRVQQHPVEVPAELHVAPVPHHRRHVRVQALGGAS
jgi:hypothetical protein